MALPCHLWAGEEGEAGFRYRHFARVSSPIVLNRPKEPTQEHERKWGDSHCCCTLRKEAFIFIVQTVQEPSKARPTFLLPVVEQDYRHFLLWFGFVSWPDVGFLHNWSSLPIFDVTVPVVVWFRIGGVS
ncbi:UNVERIFIED_CONTAM: hypothetical protein K2H54_067837 [Gekko kuhli]